MDSSESRRYVYRILEFEEGSTSLLSIVGGQNRLWSLSILDSKFSSSIYKGFINLLWSSNNLQYDRQRAFDLKYHFFAYACMRKSIHFWGCSLVNSLMKISKLVQIINYVRNLKEIILKHHLLSFLGELTWFMADLNNCSRNLYLGKGQLNSEWIYEVIVSPKMQTKKYKDFCPTKQKRIIALFWWFFWWV